MYQGLFLDVKYGDNQKYLFERTSGPCYKFREEELGFSIPESIKGFLDDIQEPFLFRQDDPFINIFDKPKENQISMRDNHDIWNVNFRKTNSDIELDTVTQKALTLPVLSYYTSFGKNPDDQK